MFTFSCPICLGSNCVNSLVTLSHAGCTFCKPCLSSYLARSIHERSGAKVVCPGYRCNGLITDEEIQTLVEPALYEAYRSFAVDLSTYALVVLFATFHFPTLEVDADSIRTLCPSSGCGAICTVSSDSFLHGQQPLVSYGRRVLFRSGTEAKREVHGRFHHCRGTHPVPVTCSVCGLCFCHRCRKPWHSEDPDLCLKASNLVRLFRLGRNNRTSDPRNHPNKTDATEPDAQTVTSSVVDQGISNDLLNPTPISAYRDPIRCSNRHFWKSKQQNRLLKSRVPCLNKLVGCSPSVDTSSLAVGFPPYPPDAWLKRCPTCLVPIERIEGCAQMLCRSCKHTFCWYCLSSLDDDFLLHHYDSGACKGKLGHSRASVFGHRVYVVAVFAGLSVLVLLTAPFVIISLPCIACMQCHRDYHRNASRRRHLMNYPLEPDLGSAKPDSATTDLVTTRSASGDVLCPTQHLDQPPDSRDTVAAVHNCSSLECLSVAESQSQIP